MASPVAGEIRTHSLYHRSFSVIYAAMMLLSLHWAVVLYINSTYLKQFVSNEAIGALYTIGSALTIIAFFFISRVLRKLGNYTLTIGLAVTEILVLIGLAMADSLRVAVPLFVLHQALVPLLLFNIDVFTEHAIGSNEQMTGRTRGVIFTIMSLAGALAPLCAGLLVGSAESPRFWLAYLAGAALMIAFCYFVLQNFKTFKDSPYPDIKVLDILRNFWDQQNLRFVFLAHFLLQLFFAWMVIYVPLYLISEIGFSWSEVGVILFVALMAYVFCEYPIGEIADRYIGEKEMMGGGFIILAITTGYIAFLDAPLLLPWMITLFMTRVGASLVEVTTESYFFKHTRASNANAISFFRTTRPLAYVIGALLGSLSLLYLPFNYMFLIIGILMIPGIFFAMRLPDTR